MTTRIILFVATLPLALHAGEFLLGGDISALPVIERHGGVFRHNAAAGDAIAIMRAHGFNCFRLRLFVEPTGKGVVVNDLPYTIALAKRIKKSGAKLLLNFHYSDTWADPGRQTKPKAWEKLPFPELQTKVFEYTRDCLAAMNKAGVAPDLVQPGNEITPGMLWPDGKLYGIGKPEEQWKKFTRLLKAGVRGIKTGLSGAKPARIIIHIDKGGSWGATKHFFERIEKHGVPYDIIGLSFYPWWHGTMKDARVCVTNAARTFKKDVFVVETAYPHRPMRHGRNHKPENMQYPKTLAGQQAFLRDLTAMVKETPNGRGLGVLWWYPEAIRVKDLRVWNGGATALFDEEGDPLPALKAGQKGRTLQEPHQ